MFPPRPQVTRCALAVLQLNKILKFIFSILFAKNRRVFELNVMRFKAQKVSQQES